jgi:hypothetical protein
VATLVARNENEAMVAPMVGSGGVCVLRESGGRFCVGAFGRNLASVAVKMFSHLIYSKNKFYTLCAFNAICQNYAAINCITFQHKKVSIPSTLTSHTLVSNITNSMEQSPREANSRSASPEMTGLL